MPLHDKHMYRCAACTQVHCTLLFCCKERPDPKCFSQFKAKKSKQLLDYLKHSDMDAITQACIICIKRNVINLKASVVQCKQLRFCFLRKRSTDHRAQYSTFQKTKVWLKMEAMCITLHQKQNTINWNCNIKAVSKDYA